MNKALKSKIKLLVVIAIAGAFVWVFILSPMITFKSNEKKLEDAAKRYYELNSNLLPTGERVGTVTLSTLYKKSFIDKDLFIPLTKKTCSVTNSWVKVRKENNEYKYYTYLECGVMNSTIDHKGPTIKLNGSDNITLGVGEEYKDPGVKSVSDNKDGKMKNSDVTIKGSVDTSKVGTFDIKYIANDDLNNTTTVIRHVEVVQKLNGLVKKNTGKDVDYYKGGNPNNYVYFSNMLFRIVGLEGNNVKIVADKDIANVNYDGIDKWFDYYEDNLTDSAKKYIKASKFCEMTAKADDYETTKCSKYGKKKKFGLISVDEINKSQGDGGSYLTGKTITWSSNTSGKGAIAFRYYFIGQAGYLMEFEKVHNFGVRPVMVIDGDILVKDGNGTYDKPYVLEDYIAPKVNINVNERYPGEYIKYNGSLWRIVNTESDGTTKIISEDTVSYEFTYNSKDRVYNPKQKGNVGYIINNETSKYINTKYFVTHEISVPIYKNEPNYGKEKETKKYKVKISSPNMYEMFSAASDTSSSYWLLNSSTNVDENPGMSDTGAVMYGFASHDYKYGIRPVAYLDSKCVISSGRGTRTNPYVIKK